ncbi:MAG: cobalt-precorrin-5B (C(1))-methyltransferase CbiD [Lachnospiraceae bacterium]|nr:cobalt-precorrin-5B (C(1))-methyltransferase CbiD [Lachnospiraceae bacterium]
MRNELLRYSDGKLRRCGYTTGSCAAAAAKAAAILLLTGERTDRVTITLPKEKSLTIEVRELRFAENGEEAVCAVEKDGGDDPDQTNGMLICASVRKTEQEIVIEGGKGIGRVTMPGLDQPVGNAAINSGPRRQITENVRAAAEEAGYTGGLSILIYAPEGERIAKKTFNPKLGIVGGISILGTTGIVEPMSSKALADSLRAEISVLAHRGVRDLLLVPGNYGSVFAKEKLGLGAADCVMCSNHIGDALAAAVEQNMRSVLLVGHIGKLVKLGIGITNTHSRCGDGRMETLCACAIQAGADVETLRSVLGSVTTEAALAELGEWRDGTLAALRIRIEETILRFVPNETRVEWICFSGTGEAAQILVESEGAEELRQHFL